MGLLAGAVILAMALHAPTPLVGPLPPPRSEDVQYARVVGWTLQYINDRPDRRGDLVGTAEEFNGLFRLLARSHPQIAGRVEVQDDALQLELSLRVPQADWLGWINLSAELLPYRGTPALRSLRVGRLPLPPELSLRAAGWVLDRSLGPGATEELFAAVPALAIDGESLRWDLVFPSGSGRYFTRAGLADLQGNDGPTPQQIMGFVEAYAAATAEGRLGADDGFVPWLRVTLQQAATAGAGDDPEPVLLAAAIALHQHCGARHNLIRYFVPGAEDALPPRATLQAGCRDITLAGRTDLRSRFVSAAAISLFLSRNAALGSGEVKELMDLSLWGFDFTDIAAHFAGVRLAGLLRRLEPEGWAALADRLGDETDLMISLRGIPGSMSEARFHTAFGEVDSPRYRAMLDEIEARIDRLPIHRAGPDG